jgi:hypothetical protein
MNLESLSKRASPAKASCSGCGRPLSILKNARCIYCGHVNQVAAAAPETPEKTVDPSVELAVAMAPGGATGGSQAMRWTVRIAALGLGGLLVFALVGPCMR